jgi:hypothetical protein
MKALLVKPVRCAIYTRVSTEHGLDQEFNSLDAQYDAASHRNRRSQHWSRRSNRGRANIDQASPVAAMDPTRNGTAFRTGRHVLGLAITMIFAAPSQRHRQQGLLVSASRMSLTAHLR